ncbi:MAG: hypothetical protein JWO31_3434 [Phycisphaerales bacterium]|nr:hypothetical protein [Phycisphaerales bacterium]
MRLPTALPVALLALLSPGVAAAQERAATRPYYEEAVAASDPLRAEQAKELDGYIHHLRQDEGRLHALFRPDYASPAAFEASAKPLREAFCASIGYPPPGDRPADPPAFTEVGRDGVGTYYRAVIPVLPGVHAEGLYIVPAGVSGRVPLVVAMHGGGGSPEVALFHGGSNYHDMVRGGAKRGYAVFAPQHLFSAPGYPKDVRKTTDERLRLAGTSLTAVETAKITRSLDVLLARPEVDPARVAMVGLSYGGYYALVAPAVDPRIKVAVSSCYYGVQEGRYERDELSVPGDFRFAGRFTLFRDADLVALICPRALQVQAGSQDDVDHREPGKLQAPRSAAYYEKLRVPDRFRHVVFEGKHEFNDEAAWAFVKQHL